MAEFLPEKDADTSSQEPANLSAATNTPELEPDGEPATAEAPSAVEAVSTEPISPPKPEDALPSEAQGETNGGPLGCCLGMMVGLLLSLTLAILSRVYATTLVGVFQGNYGLLGLLVRILMGIFAVGLAIFFGYVGWGLGKRFYREYDPPVRKSRVRTKKAQQRF